MAKLKKRPTFVIERELLSEGFCVIAGVDEAGSGALAGPVVAGAVVLSPTCRLDNVADSKLLSQMQRDELYEEITERAEFWAVGSASVEEIFEFGIRPANYLAMERALEQIVALDYALVDAWTLPNLSVPQRGIIRGDQTVKSIAAASIIAKVSRDKIMAEQSRMYPDYGFEIHKGYGTAKHRAAIDQFGACPIHRLNYKIFHPKHT